MLSGESSVEVLIFMCVELWEVCDVFIEVIVEIDDVLMMCYFDGDDVSDDELWIVFEVVICVGMFYLVIFVSVLIGVGVFELLYLFVCGLRSVEECGLVIG